MKTLITAVILVYTSLSFGQIGKSKDLINYNTVGQFGANKLEYYTSQSTNHYILVYRNQEYANIVDMKSISFTANAEELEYLYQEIKSIQKNKTEKSLEIGEDNIIIRPMSMKWVNLFINHKNDTSGFFSMSPKQLDKLFGKK